MPQLDLIDPQLIKANRPRRVDVNPNLRIHTEEDLSLPSPLRTLAYFHLVKRYEREALIERGMAIRDLNLGWSSLKSILSDSDIASQKTRDALGPLTVALSRMPAGFDDKRLSVAISALGRLTKDIDEVLRVKDETSQPNVLAKINATWHSILSRANALVLEKMIESLSDSLKRSPISSNERGVARQKADRISETLDAPIEWTGDTKQLILNYLRVRELMKSSRDNNGGELWLEKLDAYREDMLLSLFSRGPSRVTNLIDSLSKKATEGELVELLRLRSQLRVAPHDPPASTISLSNRKLHSGSTSEERPLYQHLIVRYDLDPEIALDLVRNGYKDEILINESILKRITDQAKHLIRIRPQLLTELSDQNLDSYIERLRRTVFTIQTVLPFNRLDYFNISESPLNFIPASLTETEKALSELASTKEIFLKRFRSFEPHRLWGELMAGVSEVVKGRAPRLTTRLVERASEILPVAPKEMPSLIRMAGAICSAQSLEEIAAVPGGFLESATRRDRTKPGSQTISARPEVTRYSVRTSPNTTLQFDFALGEAKNLTVAH